MIHNTKWQYIDACLKCQGYVDLNKANKLNKKEDKWSDLFMEEVYKTGGKK